MFVSEYGVGEVVGNDLKQESLWLMQGDCLERMKEIPSGSVDMVLCDLPYGTTQNKWDSVIPFNALWGEYGRICKGAVVLSAAQPFTSFMIGSNTKEFKYCWVWKKSKPTGHLNAKKQPLRNTEDIAVFYAKQPTYNPQGTRPTDVTVSRTNRGNYGECSKTTQQTVTGYPTTILEFSTEVGTHPTQKPIKLMEYLVNTYTDGGQTVLDNCMGSGTTGVACANLNRKFIGIEMDEGYFNIAKERILKSQQGKQ